MSNRRARVLNLRAPSSPTPRGAVHLRPHEVNHGISDH